MFFIVALVYSSTIGNPKELPISLLPLPLPPYAPLPPSPSAPLPPLKTPPPPSSAMVDSSVEVKKFMSPAGVLESSSKTGSVDEVGGLYNGISDLKSSESLGSVKDGMWV